MHLGDAIKKWGGCMEERVRFGLCFGGAIQNRSWSIADSRGLTNVDQRVKKYAMRITLRIGVQLLILLAAGHALCAPGDLAWSLPSMGYNVGSSPAVDSAGNLYLAEVDGLVRRITSAGAPDWDYQIDGTIRASPAVGTDGTVYIGASDGFLYALDSAGQLRWRFETGDRIDASAAIGADGTIYVGSSGANLFAIRPDGTPAWSRLVSGQVGSSIAIGHDGTIYVGTLHGSNGSLHAFSSDGTELWSYPTAGGVVSPSVGIGGRIYVGSFDGNVYALNPNGTLQWSHATGGRVASAPAVGTDGAIYVGVYDTGEVLSIDFKGGRRWTYSTGSSVYSSPAIGLDGSVYVGSGDGVVHALSDSGSITWSFASDSEVVSSPALTSNAVLFASTGGTIYRVETGTDLAGSLWPMYGQSRNHHRRSTDSDSDEDGMLDSWEVHFASAGLNPQNPNDGAGDTDFDRTTHYSEYLAGTDPTVPNDPSSGAELNVIAGDVAPLGDPDGIVDSADGAVAIRILTDDSLIPSMSILGQIRTEYGLDANSDGEWTNADAVRIIRAAVGFVP